MDQAMKKQLETAAAWTAKNHPVTDHKSNPDLYRTEKSPVDFIYQGQTVAYYDTQIALWRLGDKNDHLTNNQTFVSRPELLDYLRLTYPDQNWS